MSETDKDNIKVKQDCDWESKEDSYDNLGCHCIDDGVNDLL